MTHDPRAPIPVLDLRAQYATIREEIRAALDEVLESQRFILGPQGVALEAELAGTCGTRYGIGVGSGTDALVLALRVLGIGPGDEVIVPAFSFIATASSVMLAGAKPVFADIEPHTFNLSPGDFQARITTKTRAVIPVHLFGHPVDMDSIREIARYHDLFIIEDNAQAIGAMYKGRRTGSFGVVGCLSFYPTKNLGGYGDGGMLLTDSEELAVKLRRLRDHGQTRKYQSAEPGWNSRLDELQAAVLRVKLRHLERWNFKRQQIAARYTELLNAVEGIKLPRVAPLATHVFHQYTIRVANRDVVRQRLGDQGIATAIHYPTPLHLQASFASLGVKAGELPQSERAAQEVLSLPIYPEMTPEQIERVASAVAAALRP